MEGPLDCWIGVVDRTADRQRIRHVGVHPRVPVCRCTHAFVCSSLNDVVLLSDFFFHEACLLLKLEYRATNAASTVVLYLCRQIKSYHISLF